MNKVQNIYFQNKDLLNEKIRHIKLQGLDSLHVVSDFDRTLTRCFLKGRKVPSIVSLIREGNYLTPDYSAKAFALYDKYHKIELDESWDYDYRYNKMYEWWKLHEELLVKSGLHKNVFEDILQKHPRMFRSGVDKFLKFLHINSIPLLIFSSGLGDMILGYLAKENKLTPNVHILSNIFEFDKQGYAIGFRGDIIHTMNKSETKIRDEKYKQLIANKKNVILLGDIIGDLGMINDMDSNIIIKIGFLNEDIENNLELFISKFDIVVTNDGTMSVINNLLDELK
jgi:cytosolic 5'-nucleotidase 3